MPLKLYTLVVDCRDIAAQARWWADVLGWRIEDEDEHEVSVVPPNTPDEEVAFESWHTVPPALVFVPVEEGKTVKNRLHLDLAPHRDEDRDAYLAELEAKGARRVQVGQERAASSSVTWDVFADPEGNEFCVLSSRAR